MKIKVEAGFDNWKSIKDYLGPAVSIMETNQGISMKLNTYNGEVLDIYEGDILSDIYGPWVIERRVH